MGSNGSFISSSNGYMAMRAALSWMLVRFFALAAPNARRLYGNNFLSTF